MLRILTNKKRHDMKRRELYSFYIFMQHFLNLAGFSCSLPVLGLNTILTFLPAISYGCTQVEYSSENYRTSTALRLMTAVQSPLTEAESIDIMIFDEDDKSSLDAYQRFGLTSCSTIQVASTSGDKILAAIVNSRRERHEWAGVTSLQSLQDVRVNLEDETEDMPAMSGTCHIKAGYPANLTVSRLAAEVVLRSLCCDFTGKEYEGKGIENVKIYLTNVNAEASIMEQETPFPRRIINMGRLDEDNLKSFKKPDMIMQQLPHFIGNIPIVTDIRLRCFPNNAKEESPGSPFTRLVIEGEVDGNRYFWPIEINREDDGSGISRNCRYVYDITLTRLGNKDPDIPIELKDMKICMEILPWEEKEDYGVRF